MHPINKKQLLLPRSFQMMQTAQTLMRTGHGAADHSSFWANDHSSSGARSTGQSFQSRVRWVQLKPKERSSLSVAAGR